MQSAKYKGKRKDMRYEGRDMSARCLLRRRIFICLKRRLACPRSTLTSPYHSAKILKQVQNDGQTVVLQNDTKPKMSSRTKTRDLTAQTTQNQNASWLT